MLHRGLGMQMKLGTQNKTIDEGKQKHFFQDSSKQIRTLLL